jgi:alpha-tubulin suppressor-like RCC1 family protein
MLGPVSGGLVLRTLTAGGRHTCALSATGAAFCWGWNGFGQIGDGTTTIRLSPVPVVISDQLGLVSITAGWYHTCGLTARGTAYCWGFNMYGQLGDGSTTNRTTPVAVTGSVSFANLSLGVNHTCGKTTTGAVYCWGRNSSGQLGDGTTTDRAAPTVVKGILNIP